MKYPREFAACTSNPRSIYPPTGRAAPAVAAPRRWWFAAAGEPVLLFNSLQNHFGLLHQGRRTLN